MTRRYRYEYLMRKKQKAQAKKDREQNMTTKEKWLREIAGWLIYIAIVVCATYLIVTYVGQRTKVVGDSMLPSLHEDDNLIVDKLSYKFRDPKRFEIIVFPYRHSEDTYYIKRIIGLPGETVQIKDGCVYINDKKLDESYGLEEIDITLYGVAADPIEIGPDEYFVLGDNRNHSADSRETNVGLIHRDELIGRAWIRIWPLDGIGVIEHE